MDNFFESVLKIYRAARTTPVDEFPDVVMVLLRQIINFDSARLLTADFATGTPVVQGCIMYNIPSDNALDWENIHRNDVAYHQAIGQPNRPLSFHCPTLFAAPKHSILRDYADRYEHQNGLVMVLHDGDTGFTDGLSVYRTDSDAHFGLYDQHLMLHIMPHLQEALKLNRRLSLPSTDVPGAGALLIAKLDGTVQHCETQSQRLMRTEWPDWRPGRLPGQLFTALSTPGADSYAGKRIMVALTRVHDTLFLRIMAQSAFAQLTSRERQVACLYSKGLPAKTVAAQLGISPVTVRNFLQRIYQKLGVQNKVSLANLIGRYTFHFHE